MVTGYGFDVYSERLQGFLDSFVKNSTFKKLKQIKYYGIALNFLVNSTKDMFYKLNPTEITKLNQEINGMTPLIIVYDSKTYFGIRE